LPVSMIFKRILPLSALLLSACSSFAPSVEYGAASSQALDAVPAWSQLQNAKETAYLNQLIDSEELDTLLRQALSANPGLQQTWLTLKIRQAEQRQTGAARLPTVDAGFSASDETGSDTSFESSITVSWELDLWRKLADDASAAGKDVAEQQALYQAARDTLAAEVMTGWLAMIAQQHALDIEQRRLDTLQQNETFIRQRYRSGLGNLEDLDSARSSTSSSRATLEEYREALDVQQRAFKTLLGLGGEAGFNLSGSYPDVVTPLAGLPRQTLQRRPDLQAAWLAIEAADLRTRVAYKELLPSISLEAALQDIADSPGAALLTDPVWSLLGQLTAPLFRGGELRAAAEVADLETAQAYQAYRETLLNAVNEVEDALGQERALTRQQAHITAALTSARNNLAQYRKSYRTGLVDILDLLEVQQQTYDLEAQLNNLIYTRLANRVNLGLALGLGVDE